MTEKSITQISSKWRHDPPSVLVVDDDASLATVLAGILRQAGIRASQVLDAEAALDWCNAHHVDVVVTDLRMPRMDGLALLAAVRRRFTDLPVVILTGHADVAVAVDAMKKGAADFVTKPFDRGQVLLVIERALDARQDTPPPAHHNDGARMVLGTSQAMAEVVRLIRRAAQVMSTVLLCGESGTGKEVAARAIHAQSERRDGPFVAVQCSALPETLLESELFGYERGAFTGASVRKPGRVELARGGTLFLDEIGDVSLPIQVKLLRLLQERVFQPLGGSREQRADVRFIAATHRDLATMARTGEFREDLYYRLDVLPLRLPALRDRREDIAALAAAFCCKSGSDNGKPRIVLDAGAAELLSRQQFRGNVRELQNLVERLVVFCDDAVIDEAAVHRELARSPGVSPRQSQAGAVRSVTSMTLGACRYEAEKKAVMEALARTNGNRVQAARLLGISRRTLYNRLGGL